MKIQQLDTGPGRSARSLPEQEQYWQEQLAGCVPVLQLPLDRPRPAKPSYEAAVVCAALGVDLWQQVAKAAAAAGVSEQAFFTAAVQVVLLRYSGQDEVTIGVALSGTQGPLPVKATPAEGASFVDVAQQAADALAGAQANSLLSLEEIATAAGLSAAQNVHPIFQVACQVLGAGCSPGQRAAASGGPEVDISIQLSSGGSLQLEYMVELFNPATVQRLADSLATVLHHAALHPSTALAALPLLSAVSAEQLLAHFALREFRTHYLSGPLTHELFEAAAAASPDAPCLLFEGTTLTYGEVNRRANQLAHALIRGGAQADRPVALLLDRSPEYMVALLATLKAGSCFVPLDPAYPPDRLANCVEDAKPVLLLSQERHTELASSLRGSCPSTLEVLMLDGFWNQHGASGTPTANPGLRVEPSSLAYILFTSGSTGRPKGVMIHHRGIVDFLRGIADDLQLTPNDVGLLSITIGFDAHIYQALPALVSGGSLVIAKPDGHTDPQYMAGLIHQQLVSWFTLVPTLASLYIDAMGSKPWTAMRAILLGGEPLPRKMIATVRNLLPEASLYNAYGPTEASVAISWQRVDKLRESEPITIGRPDPNAHCYIVTPQQQKGPLLVQGAAGVMPVGAPGELLLSGPRLARGYAQRPDLTAAAFVPNPCHSLVEASLPEELRHYYRSAYRTGDLVRWRPDGTIEYLGRIDQQVKIDGVRMEIDEIEAVLAAAPGVSHAAVAARVCPSTGRKRLVGYVVPTTADREAARAHCRAKLTSAMVPSVLLALPKLPLLANGKVDKKALPEPPKPEAGSGGEEYEGPRDEVEAAVQSIWQDVLGLPGLPSVTADFFSLGGTSLKAGMIQARMQRQLGCASLPSSLVLQQRTIRALAAAIPAAGIGRAGGLDGVVGEQAAGVIPRRNWSSQLRPLSANQQQMWLLHSMGLAAAYNMQASCHLQGQLNVGALQTAVQGVLSRHEVLRLQLLEGEEGQAIGKLLPAEALSVPLAEVACPGGSAAIQAALEADLAQPFDLACPPCMRVLLLRHDAATCTLAVTMHHVAGDAWSYGVLQQDLSALYNAALQGQAPELDPLAIQYSDYAAWQAQQLAGSGSLEAQRQRDYWRRQLAGCAPVLQLPLDRPRPAEPTYAAGVLQQSLGRELMQQLGEAARGLRVSVQAVVLAAVQLLLLRYSGQDEVTVGVPTAGRQQAETHSLIGYCVNPLPIRAMPAEGATFADLARQAAETLVTALSNSLLPLAEVVEASGVPRQPGVNPLFQVMTQVLDEGIFIPSFSGIVAAPLPSDAEPRVSQVKMDLYIQLDSGGALRLEYMAELFDPATMQGMAASLATLLRHVVAALDTPIAATPLLSDGGAQHLLTSFACRELRPHYLCGPLTHELFEAAAAASPDALCLVYEGKVLSYGEVNRRANQLAHALIRGGAQRNRPIGLLLDRSSQYIVALLAVLKAGSCFVPLDPSYPPDRLANCVEDAEPVLLLSQERHTELARSLSSSCPSTPQVLLLDGFWSESVTDSATTANPGLHVDPSSLAYILFTSGSTGRPKGVMIHHLGLADFLRGLVEDLDLTRDDVGLFSITIAFDAHCYQTLPMLVTGGCLVIAKPEGHTDPPYMAALIRQQRVSFMITVPTLAALYLEALRPEPCKTLRAIAMGGEAMPRKMISTVREYLPHARLINAYGPTEATVAISWQRVDRLRESEPITIGPPDPNAHCYIVTPQQQKGPLVVHGVACLAPAGVPGELLISGPRLARGYAKRPDQTAAAFVPNPCYSLVEASLPVHLRQYYRSAYRTGDLVRWRPDGTIEYLGRIDQQVKIDGVRMEIDEIEAVLAAAPGVSQAAVAAQVAPSTGRKRLVGYVVPATADLDAARAHCRLKLTPAMVPSVLLALDSLPLLANGKVDKKALPPPPDAEPGAGKGSDGYVAPGNEVEEALQELWQDVLDLPNPPSVTADFFSLGGSSLKAGMIQARIREGLHVAGLGGMAVMQHATIRSLAAHVMALAAATKPADPGGHGSSFLTKHFSRNWQAGHGAATQKLLAGVRTFRSQRLLRLLSAEDPRLGQRLRGRAWPQRRLPYAVYLVLQYLLLVLAATPGVVAWIGQLLLLTTAYHYGVATGWLALLWVPACCVGQLAEVALTVLLTWLLLPRGLRPGPHPLWGWLHCRWAAVRAVQRAALGATAPFFTRTPLLSWGFRLLGAHIGRGALLDTARLQDPQLVSIGRGSVLGTDVAAAGVTVAPAGALGENEEPVMLVSGVRVGDECEVGHKAVLPAGARLRSGMHLRPRAAPSHPGAVGAGPLDGTPEFMAEAHLSPLLSAMVALLYYILHAFILLPGLAAVIAIMAPILGENPFNALDQRLFDTWQLDGHGPIPWRLVVWPPLFLALNMTVGQPTSAAVHTLALLAFKRIVLGALPPGTNLTRSRWLLLRFAFYRRMLEDPTHQHFRALFAGTTFLGTVYRWLGASVGKYVFLGGLTSACPDCLSLGDLVSSGGDSTVYGISADGVVGRVVVEQGATIGNACVLYPGSRMQPHSLVGNDTVLAAGEALPARVRKQGTVQYTVSQTKGDPEEGNNTHDMPLSKADSAGTSSTGSLDKLGEGGGAAPAGGMPENLMPPAWHTAAYAAASLALLPSVPVLRWAPFSFAFVLVGTVASGWAAAAYVVGIGGALALGTAWLLLLPHLVRMTRWWQAGRASVFSIAAGTCHGLLSNPMYDLLLETPFMGWAYRALGFQVGRGAVLMGYLPLERYQVSIGAGAVVEGQAFVEGHYLEALAFTYSTCSVGERAWVQQGARVMPGVAVGAAARLLPGCTVLPGEVLGEGTLWGGGVPASPQGRAVPPKASPMGTVTK